MTFADIIREAMEEEEAMKSLKVWHRGESLPEWLSPYWEAEA